MFVDSTISVPRRQKPPRHGPVDIFLVMNLMVLLRCLFARRTEDMKSGFSRYFPDQFSWVLYQLEWFGSVINNLIKSQMFL